MSGQGDVKRLAWIVVLTIAVFLLDLLAPFGFEIWTLYLLPMVFTLQPHWERLSTVNASLCTFLILAGLYWSPPGELTTAVANRTAGVATLWGLALLGPRRQQGEHALTTANTALERRLREADAELMHIDEELRGETRKRIQAEEALRESREQFTNAFRDAAIGMAVVGIDGHWLQVNRALCGIVGYTEQEMLATNFQTLTHPEDLEMDLAYAQKLLTGEVPTYQMEKRYIHKLGDIVWIQLNVSLVRDLEGQPLHFIAQIQDVTARNRVEAELRESEARLQGILNNSPTLIFLKDTEGRYLLVNQAFEQAFHVTCEEIVGRTDAEIFPPVQATEFRTNDLKVLEADAPLQFEEIALHEDGPHTSIVFKFPLRDEKGKPYAIGGIATDISVRKLMEQALRATEEDLRRVLEEREELSRDLHDNIMQTIYTVGMGLEECQHLMQESPAAAKKQLTQAIAELNLVIDELRRYLVGHDPEAPSSAEYLQSELSRLTHTVATIKGCEFRTEVEASVIKSLSRKVARQVMFIMREAVTNSLKHSKASTVFVSLKKTGTTFQLMIEDNGVGFQLESHSAHGHGLRNVAVRTQEIAGILQVSSKPGQGTRILVQFPGEQSDGHI